MSRTRRRRRKVPGASASSARRTRSPEPDRVDLTLRWTAGSLSVVAALALAVFLVRWAEDGTEPFDALKDALLEESYLALALSVGTLLIGAVLQTPAALRRRARVGAGWLAVLGVLAYTVPVTAFGRVLTSIASPNTSATGRRDPGAWDEAFLFSATFGYALLALTGALFVRRAPARTAVRRRAGRPDPEPLTLGELLAVTTLLSWMVAVPIAAVIGVGAIARTPLGSAILPRQGLGFTVLGSVACTGTLVVAAWLGWRALAARSRIDRARGAGLLHLVAVGTAFLLIGVALNQLGRVLPWWGVLLVFVGVLAGLGSGRARTARPDRLTVRRPRPEPDGARGHFRALVDMSVPRPPDPPSLRPYRGTRVDVVEIVDSRCEREVRRGKDTEGLTVVECRFADGKVRVLSRLDHGCVTGTYPIGARMSLRWRTGSGDLVGEPGPPAVPGTDGTPPAADQYVCAVRAERRWAGDALSVYLGDGVVEVRSADLGVDPGEALRAGRALVRYDERSARVTELVPFTSPEVPAAGRAGSPPPGT